VCLEQCFGLSQSSLQVQPGNGRKPKIYRKGQCHASVFTRAFTSALHSCSTTLGSSECCIVLTGGTPDAIIGAVVAGYRHVIYVASDDTEQSMMNMSDMNDESINWDTCPPCMVSTFLLLCNM